MSEQRPDQNVRGDSVLSPGYSAQLNNQQIAEIADVMFDEDEAEFLKELPSKTQARVKRFLVVLAQTGRPGFSARSAGYMSTAPIQRLCNKYPQLKQAREFAFEAAGDMIEDEAVRRAVDGVEETVWHQGSPVGTRTRYSDSLLDTVLKAAKRDKYSKKTENETTVQSGNTGVAVLPVVVPDAEQWGQQAKRVHDQQKESQREIIDGDYKKE